MSVKENVKSNEFLSAINKARDSQIVWILGFSILMFLAAQVAVPVEPVPFTLQTMIVLLSGAFLGSRNGMLSQVIYLFAGIIGLPVFAGLSLGFAVLFGPTGGYLIAFPIAAFAVGKIIEKNKSAFNVSLAMVLGSLIILALGFSYLSVFFGGNISTALFSGAIIFSVWDVIKIAAAVSIYLAISKKYPKLP